MACDKDGVCDKDVVSKMVSKMVCEKVVCVRVTKVCVFETWCVTKMCVCERWCVTKMVKDGVCGKDGV